MKKYRLIFLLLALQLCLACEKIVDIELRSTDPRLVVEAKLPAGDSIVVRLTLTKDFYQPNIFPPVTTATVTLADDEGTSETLTLIGDSDYVSQTIFGVEKHTYYLTIDYNNQLYTSQCYMPPAVQIDSLKMIKPYTLMTYSMPALCFQEPPGSENQYYRIETFLNDKKEKRATLLAAESAFDGIYIFGYPVAVQPPEDAPQESPYKDGDTIRIDLQCLDKNAFTFFNTGRNENNPTSNISGGALGYFSAYSLNRKRVTVDADGNLIKRLD